MDDSSNPLNVSWKDLDLNDSSANNRDYDAEKCRRRRRRSAYLESLRNTHKEPSTKIIKEADHEESLQRISFGSSQAFSIASSRAEPDDDDGEVSASNLDVKSIQDHKVRDGAVMYAVENEGGDLAHGLLIGWLEAVTAWIGGFLKRWIRKSDSSSEGLTDGFWKKGGANLLKTEAEKATAADFFRAGGKHLVNEMALEATQTVTDQDVS